MKLPAYRHASVIEGVAATLRTWIFERQLPMGAQLKEVELARELGVGRYSLRSAIEKLVHEGLLRHERNRGTFVRQILPGDVDDLFLIRDAIEGQAAALLAERRTDLAPLRKALDALHGLKPDITWQEQTRYDIQFHRVMNDLVGSERLRQAFNAIEPQLEFLLSIPQQDIPTPAEHAGFHDRIFEAIESGNPERSRLAVREHIGISGSQALRVIKQ